MNAMGSRRWFWVGVTLATLLAGCDIFTKSEGPTSRPAGTIDNLDALAQQQTGLSLKGTIGSATYVDGSRRLRVRGYGLVTGLAGQGSRNCPPSVREYLINEIKKQRAAMPGSKKGLPSPEKVIESLDTAVVTVEGEVPAAAAKQRTFDVTIQAVDPDTRSISGGYLLPTELKIYREVGPAEAIAGKTHAKAQGPIFTNPFAAASGSGTTINLREGLIIGGGCNLIERKLTLVSTIESYATVRQVRDTINRRFPHEPPVADAISPTNVSVLPPPEYRGNEGRFLERLLYLPLASSSILLEGQAKALLGELTRPEAPLNEISLALEGIGLSVVPMLQPLYTHARKPVNFHAARTGLRLGDELAIEVIIRHANDPRSLFRRQAIAELGECGKKHRAGAALKDLLANADPQIRLLAYEALRKVAPDTIAQVVVGDEPQNFILELVPCDGPPLIYARRTQIRRIALIGGDRMVCQPPILFAEPGKPITISAKEGDQTVTVLRKDRTGQIVLGPLQAPVGIPPLIRFLGQNLTQSRDRKLEGLGLDYGVILELLYRLCAKGGINADLRWEEPGVEDVLGPLEPMGRPESEL